MRFQDSVQAASQKKRTREIKPLRSHAARQLENEKSSLYIELNKLLPGKTISSLVKIMIVFMSAFITSMVVCIILHLLFGYGAAMIIDNKFKHKNPLYF